MELVGLGVLAIGPGMCLEHVLWARDREREPLWNLFLYLFLGALSIFPAAVVEAVVLPALRTERSLLFFALQAFLAVALVEEGSKRWLLHVRARRDRHLEEPFDYLVYAVAVALGFATLENVLYVYQHGVGVGLLRAVTAVPAHGLMGTVMGWRLARAACREGDAARRERRLAWLEPTLWHGAYDFPLLAMNGGGGGGLLLLFLTVLFALWGLCVHRVRALSHEQHHGNPPLLYPNELVRRLRALRRARGLG
jgi:RsiW-degrading membrane proteinase PrsW (M82 family)